MGRYSQSAVWQRFFEKTSMIAVKDNFGVAACLACAQVRLDLCAFALLIPIRIRGPPAPFRLDTSRRKGEQQ